MHNTFRKVGDEGAFKQIYLFFFLIIFFTALSNIFVAVIMDGYEMSKIRKAIDNNNPFPTRQHAENAVKTKKIVIDSTAGNDEAEKPLSSQASPYFKVNS